MSPSAVPVGERKLVTMLFADLSGYTALAETLDPEEVYTFLRPTMEELVAIVEGFGGSVPQIQGDGFMAVFGVPVAHEDDAERAVRAALAVRDGVRARNADRGGLQIPEVHAGVNSGEVMVAPSAESSGFAVIGDTVNTAARLADFARAGEVVVGEATHTLTAAAIRYGPRGVHRAKGKAEPLATYLALDVIGVRAAPTGVAFVDREEILGRLGRELEAVERDRRSRVLVVTGEPGIGKSRLAAELAYSVPGDRTFVGRCSPFGDQRRLGPLADIVAAALGIEPDVREPAAIKRALAGLAGGEAVALLPDLRLLLLGDHDDPSRSDRDLVRATRLIVEAAARDRPAVVAVDDLQWADRAIVELLHDALEDPWPAPVLMLGLSRDAVGRLPTVPLPALDRVSMATLAETLLGSPSAAEAVSAPIARANGNALFLEEMVGMLVERGALRHEGEAWRLIDPGAAEDVPASIRLLIAARLDALPPVEKRVLTDASVCGTVAWDGALARLSDEATVASALPGLLARGLLEPRTHSSIRGATEYGWKHALVREVAYRSLPRGARADRHEAIATWLRSVPPRRRAPVGAIAYQYERAWELRQGRTGPGPSQELTNLAADYLTRRGEQVFALQARAAEPFFRRAIRVIDGGGRSADPRLAATAYVGLSELLVERGVHTEAVDLAGRARRAADRAGDASLAARALLALGRSEADAGNMPRARRLLLDARRRFEALDDLHGQGWAWHRLSETWGWEGFERELEDLRSAYRCFSESRDGFGRAVVAGDLAYILSVQGGREFHRWFKTADRLAADDGDLRSRAWSLRTWGSYCYASGSFREAADTMARCRPVAVDAGDGYAEADTLNIGALALVGEGDLAAAERLTTEAVHVGRSLGSIRIRAMARLAIARVATRRGERSVASTALRTARTAIRTHNIVMMGSDLAEAEAMVQLDRGAWNDAIAASDRLAETLRAVPAALWEPLPELIAGRALLGRGELDLAVPALESATAAAKRVGAAGTFELASSALAQARLLAGARPRNTTTDPVERESAAIAAENDGIVAWRAADHDVALAAFDRAIDGWATLGLTAWLARAHRMRAAVLRASGDRARAAAAVARANAVADALAMKARDRAAAEHPLDVFA